MITLKDLQEAIAECQGERNPDSKTCIKLAAFYTIKDHMYPEEVAPPQGYSYAVSGEADGVIEYDSGTEFSDAVKGRDQADIWPIIDELMEAVQVIHPRLYAATIEKLRG